MQMVDVSEIAIMFKSARRVTMLIDGLPTQVECQMHSAEARKLAHILLDVAERAESDEACDECGRGAQHRLFPKKERVKQ